VFRESSEHLDQIRTYISSQAKDEIETKMLGIVRHYLIVMNIGLLLPMVALLPF